MNTIAIPRGGCALCGQEIYPGLHGTDCPKRNDYQAGIPKALRNHVLPPSTEPCEWCRMHSPASEYCTRLGYKPVGEPCQVCGNDAPRGTYTTLPKYTGPEGGDLDRPQYERGHQPPRAPEWRKEAA